MHIIKVMYFSLTNIFAFYIALFIIFLKENLIKDDISCQKKKTHPYILKKVNEIKMCFSLIKDKPQIGAV